MTCRVCGTHSAYQFTQTILDRYLCKYFFCEECGFLQTEDPHWLDEAYRSAIANADTGLVFRNIHLSKMVSMILFFVLDREGKYLDTAGGYGMFTRLMRDTGFDFYWYDLYCENLLARGFEAETTRPPFHAITAFEVFEHVPYPVEFLKEALERAGTRTIIFSTELFSGVPPAPGDWWYYTFATGQHIAFYQLKTLQYMATKLGLRWYSNGTLHMMTDRKISGTAFRVLTQPRLASVCFPLLKRALTSKTISDHKTMLAQNSDAAKAR